MIHPPPHAQTRISRAQTAINPAAAMVTAIDEAMRRGEEKVRGIGVLADRLLALAAPRVTAAAVSQDCWSTNCYCINGQYWARYCCIIDDRLGCTPCQESGVKC